MSKKSNKHRPAKPVPSPKPFHGSSRLRFVAQGLKDSSASPSGVYSSSKLRIRFLRAPDKTWHWQILRSGSIIAESNSNANYAKKDKMKRTFLRLMESVARKQWTLDEGESKLKA